MTELPTGHRLVPLHEEDAASALRIFNEHVSSGFAAYAEEPLPESFILSLLRSASGYPVIGVEQSDGGLVGFGLLRPYSPMPAFETTAVVTIFLSQAHTGRGLGSAVLERLIEEGKTKGIERVLAHISSRNPRSIRFHARHGFVECGRFPGVAHKWGETFDIVWMVKALSETEELESDPAKRGS